MTEDQDKDRKGAGQIVSGPEPSRLPKAADAWNAFRALLRPRPETGNAQPKTPRARKPASAPAKPAEAPVGGKPALWMAPFFLAFAVAFALPHVAKVMAPDDPRAFIEAAVGLLPDRAAPLADILAGWLWLPWYVALAALIMRLQAVRATARGILDAVGWSMGALAIEGAAWLFFGRVLLAGPGVAVVERDGAWQMLVAEFVFLLLTAIWFGPNTYRRTHFEQG